MMKKMLAMVLALVLLAVPVLGNAAQNADTASRTRLSFVPGDLSMILDEKYQRVYSELFSTLGVSIYTHDRNGKVALSLKGSDVLTLDMALDEDNTFYLNSNLLGNDTVAVATDEWKVLLDKLIDMLVDTGAMSLAEAREFRESMADSFSVRGKSLDVEDLMAGMDVKPLVEKVLSILAGGKVETVTEQPGDCDAAASKVSFTLKPEEMVELCTMGLDVIRSNDALMEYLDSALKEEGVEASTLLDQILEKIKQAAASMLDTVVEFHLDAKGDIVRIQVVLKVQGEDKTAELPITYTRTTTDMGVQHEVTILDMDDGTTKINVSGMYLDAGQAGLVSVNMSMDDGQGSVIMKADCVFDEKNVDFRLQAHEQEGSRANGIALHLVAKETDTATSMQIKLDLSEGGESVSAGMNLTSNKQSADSSVSSGVLEFYAEEAGTKVSLAGEYTVTTSAVAMGERKEGVWKLTMAVNGEQIHLMTVKTVTEDCAVEPVAGKGKVVHPAAMTEQELSAWGADVAQSAKIALLSMVQKLPMSILMLLMGI